MSYRPVEVDQSKRGVVLMVPPQRACGSAGGGDGHCFIVGKYLNGLKERG